MIKRSKIVSLLLLLSIILCTMFSNSDIANAKSKTKKAYTAYADAIYNDFASYLESDCKWYLTDIVGDKTKELFLITRVGYEISLDVYAYSNGTAKSICSAPLEESFSYYYHNKDKTLWLTAEGAGGVVEKYKITRNGLKLVVSYNCEMAPPDYLYYKIKSDGTRSNISDNTYGKMWDYASKKAAKLKICMLIDLESKLRNLGK